MGETKKPINPWLFRGASLGSFLLFLLIQIILSGLLEVEDINAKTDTIMGVCLWAFISAILMFEEEPEQWIKEFRRLIKFTGKEKHVTETIARILLVLPLFLVVLVIFYLFKSELHLVLSFRDFGLMGSATILLFGRDKLLDWLER